MTQEELLKSIASDLRKTADDIEALAGLKPDAEPEKKPEPPAEPDPEEKPVTLEQLRTVLSDKSAQGFGNQVRELIRSYGAEKLSAVDPSHYGEMLKKAEVIGNAG